MIRLQGGRKENRKGKKKMAYLLDAAAFMQLQINAIKHFWVGNKVVLQLLCCFDVAAHRVA